MINRKFMKIRFFKSILLLLYVIPFVAYAENVSVDRARIIAEKFHVNNGTRAGKPELILKSSNKLNKLSRADDSAPAFYVFGYSSGGFVIVSGDDAIAPILGYSFDSEFDAEDMPSNLEWWLDELACGIESARTHRQRQSADVAARWENTAMATRAMNAKLLKTANWSQDEPYNLKCPVINGSRALTGCVATAIAIIMRYHCWPIRGKGVLPDYSYEYNNVEGSIKGYELGHKYDWNNMPLDYTRNSTDEQKEAIAQLMLDCGVMSQMMYSPEASGAITYIGFSSLLNYMSYDKSAYQACYGCEGNVENIDSVDEWKQMLVSSITEGCPVLYSGISHVGEGHAFVIDGYDADVLFHINWGWGGSSNGYYEFPKFGNFPYEQWAYFGLKKMQNGDADEGGVIENETSFEYYTKEKNIVIETIPGINWSISYDDSVVESGIVPADGNISLKASSYKSGIYTISLSNDSEVKELKIRIH